jgi:hypothetical protein
VEQSFFLLPYFSWLDWVIPDRRKQRQKRKRPALGAGRYK